VESLTSVVYTQFPLESVVDPVAVIVTTAIAPVLRLDEPVSVTVTTTTTGVSPREDHPLRTPSYLVCGYSKLCKDFGGDSCVSKWGHRTHQTVPSS
jgi:hypothetical protein